MKSLTLLVCVLVLVVLRAEAVSPSSPAKARPSKDGQLALARYYGLKVPQDFYKAYRHAHNGAATGDSFAVVVQALCLGRGRGVAQDIEGARKLLVVLVAKNDPFACAAAAVILGQGRRSDELFPPVIAEEFGVEFAEVPTYDPVERRRLVQEALTGLEPRLASDPVACVVAGQLSSWGIAVPKNEARARELFLRAWELGCSDAGNQLGLIFQEGEPAMRNHEEALRWFRKAAEAGHMVAKCNLALFAGWATADSGKQAERLAMLHAAAEAGFAEAIERLGLSYLNGIGVKADRVRGREWSEKAIPFGRSESMAAVGKMLCDQPSNAQERLRGLRLQRQAIARRSETAAYDMSWRYLQGEPDLPPKPQLGFRLASIAAESGVKDAWGAIGYAYARGLGVTKEEDKALSAFRKGIEIGSIECHFHLGNFYSEMPRGDFESAYRHYAQGAEGGSQNAMRETGRCLLGGKGTAKDETAGVAWLSKAAEQDDIGAKVLLAGALRLGLGVAPNPARAVSLYREATEQGDSAAMALLACCLRDGVGVPVNLAEAVVWMRKSAEAGNRDGATMHAQELIKGLNVPANPSEAWKWMQIAANLGQPEACTMVGDWHREGRAGPASASEAFRWYEKAAQLGSPRGTNSLGYSYQIGAGVTADPSRAFELFTKAVAAGDPGALINLAICYELGIGVGIDLPKALQLREQHRKVMSK